MELGGTDNFNYLPQLQAQLPNLICVPKRIGRWHSKHQFCAALPPNLSPSALSPHMGSYLHHYLWTWIWAILQFNCTNVKCFPTATRCFRYSWRSNDIIPSKRSWLRHGGSRGWQTWKCGKQLNTKPPSECEPKLSPMQFTTPFTRFFNVF